MKSAQTGEKIDEFHLVQVNPARDLIALMGVGDVLEQPRTGFLHDIDAWRDVNARPANSAQISLGAELVRRTHDLAHVRQSAWGYGVRRNACFRRPAQFLAPRIPHCHSLLNF
jgi:hypothetical protein